jgi:hypothetical protein
MGRGHRFQPPARARSRAYLGFRGVDSRSAGRSRRPPFTSGHAPGHVGRGGKPMCHLVKDGDFPYPLGIRGFWPPAGGASMSRQVLSPCGHHVRSNAEAYFRRDRSAPSKRSSRRRFFRGSPQGKANGSSGTPAPARVSRKRIGMVHRGSAGPTLRTRDGHRSARNPARDTAELAEFPSKGKDRAYLDQRGSSHFRAD